MSAFRYTNFCLINCTYDGREVKTFESHAEVFIFCGLADDEFNCLCLTRFTIG